MEEDDDAMGEHTRALSLQSRSVDCRTIRKVRYFTR